MVLQLTSTKISSLGKMGCQSWPTGCGATSLNIIGTQIVDGEVVSMLKGWMGTAAPLDSEFVKGGLVRPS